METITLNNGVEIPQLGFGVFQIPAAETEATVLKALEIGYRAFDTAAIYNNEKAVGRAIAASGIPRDDLFLTTKLWVSDSGEQAAKKAFELSAEKLGVETLDLYLIHQPFGDYYGSWRAMEQLYADGRIRAIGVSNFYPDRLIDLITHTEVVPMVNQIETHPFFQRAAYQEKMREWGVQIESWAPFAEGRQEIFTNPVLKAIAESHNKTTGQVILRWLIQRGVIVIPKSVRPERMRENFEIFDFSLTEDDMQTIAALDTGASLFLDHTDPETVTTLSAAKVPQD